jgi:drug/metabolite transporter (DMT)-like permease
MSNTSSTPLAIKRMYLVILAFAAIYIIWGSTYLAIIFTIRDIPPFLMSGFRFLAAGILIYSWCLFKNRETVSFISFSRNTLCGILMLCGGTVSVAWAEQYISSSIAAVVVTSVPFWFVLLDKKQWSFYFSNKSVIAGLLIGFVGVILLMASHQQGTHPVKNEWSGFMIIVAGGIAWVSGSLYSKYKPTNNSTQMNATIQLLTAGVFCMMISVFSGEAKNFSFVYVTNAAWLGLLYLIIPGSLIAYLSYIWLLKVRPVAEVSTYVYVNPVVAILLGAMLGGEKIGWIQVVALTIILTGILFVNRTRYQGKTYRLNFPLFKKWEKRRA